MIKGALFDIDDTLFSHELKAVPKATMHLLDKLREKGIRIGVCTSRNSAEMDTIPDELWKRIDCKIFGTGAVTMVENRYYKSYTIDRKDAYRYTQYFNEHQISYNYTDLNGDLFYWGDLDKVNSGRYLRFAKGKVMFKEYEDEDITNLFFYEAKDEEVEEIKQINPDIQISFWGNSGNICAELVDKSFGLLKFCQVYSFTTDEIVAAGDGGNDDVMLEMAGIGIATDDAKENTRKCADYVCKKSIEDGGLYDAFVDLKIIEEDRYDPKIFVFDIDSTLFDHEAGDICQTSLNCMEKLKEKGCRIVLNSSRSLQEMYNIPEKLLHMCDCLIQLDGAYIRNKDETKVRYLKKENLQKVISFFEENDVTCRYALKDGTGYLNREDPEVIQLMKKLYGIVPEIKAYDGEQVLEILYFVTDGRRDQIRELMKDESHFDLKIGGEIAPFEINKAKAMLEVVKSYGLHREDICAFGDAYNDIEMLKTAGLGIAMGNAVRECKDAADYITASVSEDGICKALIHFGLIKEDL